MNAKMCRVVSCAEIVILTSVAVTITTNQGDAETTGHENAGRENDGPKT